MAFARSVRQSFSIALAAAGALVCRVSAQIDRPAGAQRVVKVFDFEERPVNVEPVPMNWVRAVNDPPERIRPGFPAWNEPSFDDAQHVSGQWSVKLPTKGGSASLRLSPGALAAIPGADYLITAKVRTEGLENARAQLAARLLDARREPISGAEARGPLVVSEQRWSETSLELRGDFPNAAWIQIDLELLQPDQILALSPSKRVVNPRRLVFEDVRGAAWFDDVVVQQLPRVELRTDSPTNILISPESPRLTTRVKDLTGEDLRAELRVLDVDGNEVDRKQYAVGWSGRPTAWTPRLPSFGWYRAALEIRASGTGPVVAAQSIDFVYAPARARPLGSERSRFAVLAEDLPEGQRATLADMLKRIGAGAVQITPWSPGATLDDLREAGGGVASLVEPLLEDHQSITFTLGRLPDELAERVRVPGDNPLDLVAHDEKEWSPYLDRILARYGQRVRRWQLGASGDDYAFWRPDTTQDVKRFAEVLERLSPEPVIALPWRADRLVEPAIASEASLTVTLPPEIGAPGIMDVAKSWPEGADVTLVVVPPPATAFGERATLIELARRTVEAWRAQPAAVAIRRPWRTDPETNAIQPTPELAVYRQLVERLAGRRVVAELPTSDGVVGYILQGGDADAIVAWNDHAEPENAAIRAYLGQGTVTVTDLYGNTQPVAPEDGIHTIRLTETPVFVEGVDVNLARFRAGVRVDPPFIASTAERHDLDVVLQNPWPVAISGRLRIAEPAHWKISPRVLAFTIAPGKSERIPFEASFGVAEEAGPATMVIEVELVADRAYPPLRLTPRLDIGLPYVQLDPSYRIEAGRPSEPADVAVSLVITNTGDHPLTMQAFAQAPDFPREVAPVSNLPPSASIVKHFVFRGGGAKLKGQQIRVGLIETEGLGRLNRTLKVD